MKLVKQLYQELFSDHLRGEIKLTLFKILRQLKILPLLKKLGFLTVNDYLRINFDNAEEIFRICHENTKIHKITEEIVTQAAKHLPEQVLDDIKPFVTVAETVLIETIDCGFSFRNNHLLDKNFNVIGGYRIKFDNLPVYIQSLTNVMKLSGKVAYLSDPEPSNYYHWMCVTLPLLRFYQKYYNLTDIDFFYVGQFPLSGFHKETLAKAGISMEKIIQESCTADKLVAAISSRFIGVNDPISSEAYHFTRNLFQNQCQGLCKTDTETQKNRFYVQRGNVNRRRVINEDEVIDLLSTYGFKTVQMDNKTVQEQAEIFSQAEAIVAPHGAALTNLLFAQPKTTVIEIFPDGFTNNCFYVLANHGDLNYFYLQSESIAQNKPAHHRDIYVDIQKLEQICKIALLDSSKSLQIKSIYQLEVEHL
ncbi:MAG: glycosyltransferase family 61 protein [Calothrix sp. C42_A2020_038]|nr:glycosyltransferase family 61 protein [Calothrix sp. C42_A2020_038]